MIRTVIFGHDAPLHHRNTQLGRPFRHQMMQDLTIGAYLPSPNGLEEPFGSAPARDTDILFGLSGPAWHC